MESKIEIEKYEFKTCVMFCTEDCPANPTHNIGSWECGSKCPYECIIDIENTTIQCSALNEALKKSNN